MILIILLLNRPNVCLFLSVVLTVLILAQTHLMLLIQLGILPQNGCLTITNSLQLVCYFMSIIQ